MTKPSGKIFSLIFDKSTLYSLLLHQDPRCLEYLNATDSKNFRVFLEPVNNTEESKIMDALNPKKSKSEERP